MIALAMILACIISILVMVGMLRAIFSVKAELIPVIIIGVPTLIIAVIPSIITLIA